MKQKLLNLAVVPLAALVLIAVADVAQAYPSRAGDCGVCHGIMEPESKTGDFDIKDSDGNLTNMFTVEAGESTEFWFELTRLVEDHMAPGTVRRGYLTIDGLDLLSIGAHAGAEDPDYGLIPYTARKYTSDTVGDDGWHEGRGGSRYFGPYGQLFAQSTTDPAASLPFQLTVGEDVEPGDYSVKATLAGGRPTDDEYLNGWMSAHSFTVRVEPANGGVIPEPGTLVLIVSGLGALGLFLRHRRKKGNA